MTEQSTRSPCSATNKGTDQPWERPSQAAQNPHAKLADSKTRQWEYKDRTGKADLALYQQTSSTPASVAEPLPQTSDAADKEGKVGDPLPIALLVIVAVPIFLMIAALVWWVAR